MSTSSPTDRSGLRVAFGVVTTLCFLWGFITVMVDALVPRLKAVFELSTYGLSRFRQVADVYTSRAPLSTVNI